MYSFNCTSLTVGTDDDSDDEQEHESKKWIHAVDRDSLVTINNMTFDFLVAVELQF